jgi:hypothetical protein
MFKNSFLLLLLNPFVCCHDFPDLTKIIMYYYVLLCRYYNVGIVLLCRYYNVGIVLLCRYYVCM